MFNPVKFENIFAYNIKITPPKYNDQTKTWDVRIDTFKEAKIEQFDTRDMARYWTKIYKYMLSE